MSLPIFVVPTNVLEFRRFHSNDYRLEIFNSHMVVPPNVVPGLVFTKIFVPMVAVPMIAVPRIVVPMIVVPMTIVLMSLLFYVICRDWWHSPVTLLQGDKNCGMA